jgi:hypothetical protein
VKALKTVAKFAWLPGGCAIVLGSLKALGDLGLKIMAASTLIMMVTIFVWFVGFIGASIADDLGWFE